MTFLFLECGAVRRFCFLICCVVTSASSQNQKQKRRTAPHSKSPLETEGNRRHNFVCRSCPLPPETAMQPLHERPRYQAGFGVSALRLPLLLTLPFVAALAVGWVL